MKIQWHKIFSLFLVFLFTVGCGAINQIKKEFEKTQQSKILTSKDGDCQLTVPGTWREDSDLHEEAIIQTSQRFGELYVVVLSSNKEDFTNEMTLDSLTKMLRASMSNNLMQSESTNPVRTTVNHLPAEQFEMSGSISGIKAKYVYTVVETPDNFYQILAWTLASRYDSNKQKLLDVTNSFQEANAPPKTIKSLPPKSKF